MSNTSEFHSSAAMREVVHLLLSCVLLSGVVYGQVEQNQPDKLANGTNKADVADAIAKVESGDFSRIHVEMIARAGAVEAIPILKDQFVHSQDPLTKEKIANALVRLGNKDDTYWNYLVEQAIPAVESDAPDFMNFDSQGKALPGPSAAFAAWAAAHNLSVPDAVDALHSLPGAVLDLGQTGDPRAIPLLRRALLSPNYMIEAFAAKGLAQIKDKDSIPLIIEACRRAPAEAAALIAAPLVYFDDSQAQSAVDKYVPEDMAKANREKRDGGKLPFD